MRFTQWARLYKIGYVWVKYGLDEIVFSIPWFRAFRFAVYLNPVNWVRDRRLSVGDRLRLALQELGPIFVKFGQILSTRRDVLPDDVAIALAKLQDQVAPFPGHIAREMIEQALGASVTEVFAEFSEEPLASASIAQVHTARLKTGEEVVIKVLRPNIEGVLRNDISLLYSLARVVDRYWKPSKRLKPLQVVREIERNVLDELDLMREASNASQLKRNFADTHILQVPDIYWDYCRPNVLVMERVHGVSSSDVETLRDSGVDLKKLAERGVEIFYTQVFRDCFFHADMHPGNIWINWDNPTDPYYIALDFGIMGTLTKEDQHYLAGNFLAFFRRDYRRAAELHIESGWVGKGTRVDELESAIRTICEPIFEKPLKDISLGQSLLRLFQIARRFEMEVLPQLLLLQKTLVNIEGMGRNLYPELDLWRTAKPFLEKWMHHHVGLRGFLRRVKEQLPYLSEMLPEMPRLIHRNLTLQSKCLKVQLEQIEQDQKPVVPNARGGKGLIIAGVALLLVAGFGELGQGHWLLIKEWIELHDIVIAGVGLIALLLAAVR
jgi:ubiquinone biosynthesis protein